MAKNKVKIENTTLERDVHSKAIIETSDREYTAHLRRRESDRQAKEMSNKMDKILDLLSKSGVNLADL